MSAPQDPATSAAGPQVKVIRCPSCGGSITLRALGQSVMAVCPKCNAHLDVSQPEIRLIRKYQEQTAKLHLQLGAHGILQGQKFEVIGALQRSEDAYAWEEYLLFNPFVGFRWLTFDHGHWNFGQAVKDISRIAIDGDSARYDGRVFRLFHRGTPEVGWVVGEFYWRVATDDRADCEDYVCPPLMLSRERAGGEVNWTLLHYLQPAEIHAAFGISTREPVGIAANQPNTSGADTRLLATVTVAALIAALLIQIVTVSRSRDTEIPLGRYQFAHTPNGEEQVYGPFQLPAAHSLNEVTASVPLDNTWVELDCSLVDTVTGASIDFLNAFEYYSGVDTDGSWTEGSWTGTALLPAVPAGTYNLVVEGTSQDPRGQPVASPVSLSLQHDIAPWRNFFIALGAILLYPAFLLWRHVSFEKRRWSQSDSADDDD